MGEWCAEVRGWSGGPKGWIPHRVLIALGIATEEELSWFRWTPQRGTERHTIWFTREQAATIRAHPEFASVSSAQGLDRREQGS